MNRFFALLPIAFALVGCNTPTEEPAVNSAAVPAETSTLDISLPSADMLAAIGPQNNIPIRHLLPDAVVAFVGKPKQFLSSPLGVGNEPLISTLMMQGLQLYRFDYSHIDRFVQTSSLPMPVAINVPNPQDPSALPQQRILQIARRTTIVTFDAPVEKATFFTTVLNLDPASLETRKRTAGTFEYYDLTPPDIIIPQKLALCVLDDHNVLFAEGLESDINAVFSGVIPKNAVLDRLKHTPVDTNELTILTSLEGQNVSPQMLDAMMGQLSEAGYIPQNLAMLITQHLRALTFSLNVSAAAGQPVLSMAVEGRDAKSAESLGDAIQGMVVNGQTTVLAMNEDVKKTLMMPPDFVLTLLNSITVETKDLIVRTVLHNFDALIPTFSAEIQKRQTFMQQQQLQQQRAEQLMMLAQLWVDYYDENKKIPADITDAEGKPLLSWRVALLPKLGFEDLYKKFKLDEPWDSETNKELLNTMPILFHPLVPDVAPPKTIVRFFDSAGTPFSNKDLKAEEIAHPQSTLLFAAVTPEYAVEWTKPDSLEFNIKEFPKIVGNSLFGITFTGQICQMPLLSESDPLYEKQQKDIEALVKGLPLQTPEQQPAQETLPQEPKE